MTYTKQLTITDMKTVNEGADAKTTLTYYTAEDKNEKSTKYLYISAQNLNVSVVYEHDLKDVPLSFVKMWRYPMEKQKIYNGITSADIDKQFNLLYSSLFLEDSETINKEIIVITSYELAKAGFIYGYDSSGNPKTYPENNPIKVIYEQINGVKTIKDSSAIITLPGGIPSETRENKTVYYSNNKKLKSHLFISQENPTNAEEYVSNIYPICVYVDEDEPYEAYNIKLQNGEIPYNYYILDESGHIGENINDNNYKFILDYSTKASNKETEIIINCDKNFNFINNIIPVESPYILPVVIIYHKAIEQQAPKENPVICGYCVNTSGIGEITIYTLYADKENGIFISTEEGDKQTLIINEFHEVEDDYNAYTKFIIEYNSIINTYQQEETIKEELKDNLSEISAVVGEQSSGIIQITGINDNFQFSLCLSLETELSTGAYKFNPSLSAFTSYECYKFGEISKYAETNISKINIFTNTGYNNKQEFSRIAPGYEEETLFNISKDKYENGNIASRYFAVPMYSATLNISGDIEAGEFNLLRTQFNKNVSDYNLCLDYESKYTKAYNDIVKMKCVEYYVKNMPHSFAEYLKMAPPLIPGIEETTASETDKNYLKLFDFVNQEGIKTTLYGPFLSTLDNKFYMMDEDGTFYKFTNINNYERIDENLSMRVSVVSNTLTDPITKEEVSYELPSYLNIILNNSSFLIGRVSGTNDETGEKVENEIFYVDLPMMDISNKPAMNVIDYTQRPDNIIPFSLYNGKLNYWKRPTVFYKMTYTGRTNPTFYHSEDIPRHDKVLISPASLNKLASADRPNIIALASPIYDHLTELYTDNEFKVENDSYNLIFNKRDMSFTLIWD